MTLASVADAYELSVANGIAVVTFARPERLNALHPAAHYALCDLFDRLAEMDGMRVVIVTGAGKAFCAGYDLKDSLNAEMQVSTKGFGGLGAQIGRAHV